MILAFKYIYKSSLVFNFVEEVKVDYLHLKYMTRAEMTPL
jgi:hypothetical protein